MPSEKLKYKTLSDCTKNAKSKKEKLNCRRIYGNIFNDPVSKKQQAKQDSALYKEPDKDNIFYTPPKKKKK